MPVFSHDYLRHYLRERLNEAAVNAEVAGLVADNLVESSLKGHDSHGVSMLPRYIAAIREGGLAPHAQAEKNARCRADAGVFRTAWFRPGSSPAGDRTRH
ncbi:hypothetical protein DZS_40410 [Dickeya ananatis]